MYYSCKDILFPTGVLPKCHRNNPTRGAICFDLLGIYSYSVRPQSLVFPHIAPDSRIIFYPSGIMRLKYSLTSLVQAFSGVLPLRNHVQRRKKLYINVGINVFSLWGSMPKLAIQPKERERERVKPPRKIYPARGATNQAPGFPSPRTLVAEKPRKVF